MRVLITGANRGIGRALLDAGTARSDTVTGTARDPKQGKGWLRLDLLDPGSVGAMKAAFGEEPLDLLVCNAGVYLEKGHDLAAGFDAPLWADSFAVNVTGVFLTIQALLPNLRAT